MTKENSWRAVMPRTFHWLEGLQLDTASGLTQGAVHIIPTTCEKDKDPQPDVGTVPQDIAPHITAALADDGWCGKSGSHLIKIDGYYFLLLPTSKFDTSHSQKARQIGLDAAQHLVDFKFSHLIICSSQLDPLAIFDGLVMGLYSMKFNHTPAAKNDEESLPTKVQILGDVTESAIARTKDLARAVVITRTLQDSPPNWLNSEKLAELAEGIAAELKISCQSMGRDKLEELGMGSFLSVAKGSITDPRMIIMEVTGKDPSRKVALIGKGITFDSGGISLKPGGSMVDMKYDMSGAAAVLGTMCFLAREKPPVTVIGLLGAVENMPSSRATRPGDIVTAMDNTSIEVLNTDAEGRLVLADLICYTVKNYKPELIIDVATLTGAVIYALNQNGAGLMSNNQKAADRVLQAAAAAGEPLWQLPMWPELVKEVKGTYADLQNITAPNVKGGTITAAWFLERFVKKTPWVHLDVAGTAWDCKATGYPKKGSCAFSLRTMAEVCHSL